MTGNPSTVLLIIFMKSLATFLLLTCSFYSYSQALSPEELIAKGVEIGNVDMDSAIVLFNQAREEAVSTSDSLQEARAYFYIARYNVRLTKYHLALEDYQNSWDKFMALGDKFRANSCIYEKGNCYYHLKMFDEALNCYYQSLAYMESRQDSLGKSNQSGLLTNISTIYFSMRKYDEAAVHLKKALDIARESNDSTRLALSLTLLGSSMLESEIGIEEAWEYMNEARVITRDIGDLRTNALVELRIASYYRSQKDYDNAIKFYEKSRKISENVNHYEIVAESNNYLAEIHYYLGNLDIGYDFALKGLEVALEHGLGSAQELAYQNLQVIYAGKGQYKQAYEALEMEKHIHDSLGSLTELLEIGRIESRYEVRLSKEKVARQQEQIENLEERNRRSEQITQLWIAVIVLLTLLTIGIITFFLVRRKKDKRILVQEQLLAKNLNESLQHREREVVDLASAISYKNQILNRVDAAILDVSKEPEISTIKSRIKTLKRDLNLLESDKQQVERLFALGEDVQREFHGRLKENYELTPRELRLVTLVRLGLSIKEISGVLSVTEKAVEMAKYRLKKKMALDSNEDLNTFIRNL